MLKKMQYANGLFNNKSTLYTAHWVNDQASDNLGIYYAFQVTVQSCETQCGNPILIFGTLIINNLDASINQMIPYIPETNMSEV